MQITFNTSEVSPKEAAGLAALLVTLHGSAVLAALEDVDFGRTAVTVNNGVSETTSPSRHDFDVRAADGHPTEANAAEAFGATPTGGLDSAGTPWDERIHSGSRGTNKDGTWTRRRNTPDETFDTVMAELKGRAAPAGASAENDLAPKTDMVEDLNPAPAAPPPPPPAAPAAPPAPPASAAPITFPTLMVKITKAQGAGQIDKATVDGFIKEFGAEGMMDFGRKFGHDADKLAELNKLVDTVLGNG